MSFQDYSNSNDVKKRLGTMNPKLLVGALVLAAIIAIGIACNVVSSMPDENAGFAIEKAESSETEGSDSEATAKSEEPPAQVCVYVSGCVANPGVCYLDEGSRVADAVEAAGGMTDQAAMEEVNLARALVDGEQISIPSIEQVQAASEAGLQASSGTQESTGAASSVQGGSTSGQSGQSGKVNINTATSEELQTISGIGESKASKIIDYREKNGPFKSVDELTNVSGIGARTLEAMRESICV